MQTSDSRRPDPDALLAHLQAQEERALRGKLRIYFGASAGVGKTFAMLNAAHRLLAENIDVLVGVAETHGRAETAGQLAGLPLLPPKTVVHRGKAMQEFDIDAALERRPALILIDELAHTNAPGSRHAKRWQDVEELLAAGINVFATLNVQHLESLNDVVGGITGVRVAETMPDTQFDHADEVVLVDLPADELLARLKAGKVYPPQHAERAAQHFFRKGNLIALRELALRRTADRIGDDVQAYRVEKSIGAVWQTDAALLALVGPGPDAGHVVRSAARLANQMNAAWHAVYIETPRLQRLPSHRRERILQTLKLAQQLGATTAVLSGPDAATAATTYARSHNFSKFMLGRRRPWSALSLRGLAELALRSPGPAIGRLPWLPWRQRLAQRIAAAAPEADVIELGMAVTRADSPATGLPRTDAAPQAGNAEDANQTAQDDGARMPRPGGLLSYAVAAGASIVTTLLAMPLLPHFDLANIVMIYLLTVVLVAMRLGRGPAIVSTFAGVAAFDYFFVAPRFSFAVSDLQYAVTFGVMLAVGVIIAHLTSSLQFQARIARHREARSRALYEFARELSGVLVTDQIFEIVCRAIERTFGGKVVLLLPDADGKLHDAGAAAAEPRSDPASETAPLQMSTLDGVDPGTAQWAFDHATPAGAGTDTLAGSAVFYMPLLAPMRTRGVLAITPKNRRWSLIPEQRQQFDTFAALAAIALERMHYIEVAQDALVTMESERLRNSLLTALSHDLRTPLTALVGLSDALAGARPPLAPEQQSLAGALHQEALRMSEMVTNLLDMARMQSGNVELNLQWQPLEEVVGSAVRACGRSLAAHVVVTRLAPDLPLLRFDAVLLERVFCNLLENAAKYTPPGSHITIAAECAGDTVQVAVQDDGPGLPVGREQVLFEKFTRGERESATPGVGLGLAICQAIVVAHGGSIAARRAPQGGASIVFTLPLGVPPALPDHEEQGMP